uniref:ATP-binding cassette domain-containing protein n=1 Tax=Pseudomonas proteolytica TaxID=219574 RepID=UPI0030D8A025
AVDHVLSIFPKLGQRLDQPAGTLSGGERKMLAIGRAMLGDPKLLLLDEPTEGLDSVTARIVLERLDDRLRRRGQGLLIVSHAPLTPALALDGEIMPASRTAASDHRGVLFVG